jgi:preprotein translocase subunit SecE
MANAAIETTPQTESLQRVAAGPERLIEFLKSTRQEMHKVNTPTREQVQTGTIVVIVTVFIFAAYFELVDVVIGKGIDQLLLHMTKH